MAKVIGIIPARMASARFPGKPLIEILGMPMVVHVLKRAKLCKRLDDVFVATDSPEIFNCVLKYKGKAIMTASTHKTGTDRIAEACSKIDCDIVVNIQGDEPLVKPAEIDKLVDCISADKVVNFATIVCKTTKFNDFTECKVALNRNMDIMYISRSDIPSNGRSVPKYLYKHNCIVAFRKKALKLYSSWPQTDLEKIEYVEYLRILENGYKIRAIVVNGYSTSVDTPEDLKIVLDLMKKDTVKVKYLNKE